MKSNVIEVINAIHDKGLENTMWNIERETQNISYYGCEDPFTTTLAPHIALFYDYDDPLTDIYNRCDLGLWSKTLGFIFIYFL